MRPVVVVTVDVEEEGLWSGVYRAVGNRCRNVAELPRVHEVLAPLGVRPTYLVDYPVATDGAAARVLGELAAGGAAEIGAHLHPWCTPPLSPDGTRGRALFAHRLPPPLLLDKLALLQRAIADAFGTTPSSYRAGRWGFDHTSVPLLERLGFTVDTSVDPLFWNREPGGPEFVRARPWPYRLDARGRLVEVPVSTAFTGRLAGTLERAVRAVAPLPGLRRCMVRAGLCSLKPEIFPLARMCALADELFVRGVPVFNVMFHSSTALAGATPYASGQRAVGEFVRRVGDLAAYLTGRYAALPLVLSEVPAHLGLQAASNSRTKRAAAASSE
jgi:hypothetical protein